MHASYAYLQLSSCVMLQATNIQCYPSVRCSNYYSTHFPPASPPPPHTQNPRRQERRFKTTERISLTACANIPLRFSSDKCSACVCVVVQGLLLTIVMICGHVLMIPVQNLQPQHSHTDRHSPFFTPSLPSLPASYRPAAQLVYPHTDARMSGRRSLGVSAHARDLYYYSAAAG